MLNINSQFDVLVVGAGAAGLYTALCLPEHLQVGLITKETVSLSASDWAQGGIAAAIAPEDSAYCTLKILYAQVQDYAIQKQWNSSPNTPKVVFNL
jgi:aspartate oxidase